MNDENRFPTFSIPNLESSYDFNYIQKQIDKSIRETQKIQDGIYEEREKRYKDSVSRENKIIDLLSSIDTNTSVLKDVVRLVQESNVNQKEILNIINEINLIATAKTKEEAESLFQKVFNKINTTISNVETMQTLMNYGM